MNEWTFHKSEYDPSFVYEVWKQEFCVKLSYTEDAHIDPRHRINSQILLLCVQRTLLWVRI